MLQLPQQVSNAIGVLCMGYLQLSSFVGPIDFTPFQNRLVNTITTGLEVFLLHIYTATGATAAEHPAEPYQTMMVPLTNSAFSTLRSLDAFTDLGLVRLLWDKGPNCAWFGRQTACRRFRVMAMVAGTCALIQIALSAAVVLVGGQSIMYGEDTRRCVAHVSELVLFVGIQGLCGQLELFRLNCASTQSLIVCGSTLTHMQSLHAVFSCSCSMQSCWLRERAPQRQGVLALLCASVPHCQPLHQTCMQRNAFHNVELVLILSRDRLAVAKCRRPNNAPQAVTLMCVTTACMTSWHVSLCFQKHGRA
eukprot:jgi/Ulvmu1/9637/UM054_0069.1